MNPDREASIDAIMAELVAQRLEGKTPDIDAAIAAHPDLGDEIRVRFADLERLAALWQQMSEASRGQSAAPALRPGIQMGDFEIRRRLGHGGMGAVYLARQKSLGRDVALKVISHLGGLSPTTRQRFLREAEALGSLSHPNIVPVFAAGEAEDTLYIAMEFVEGASLADILDAVRLRPPAQRAIEAWQVAVAGEHAPGAPPEPAEVSHVQGPSLDREYIRTCCRGVADVARALHAAHEKGVVHRDVKPSNIIIDRTGRPRLLDFGLASIEARPHVTVSGEFFGTPHYVAPEQARGLHEQIDRRADVYSLGATLYECLTLTTPFSGKSTPEILSQVINGEPRLARRVNPSLPKDLETIVAKAMESALDARYTSSADFADDLERFLDGLPVLARRASVVTRIAKRVRRRPVHAALAILLVLLTIAGIAVLLHWRATAKHLEYERLMDEGYVLLHRAMVGPRPMWLPEEIECRRNEAIDRFSHAIEIEPRSFQAHMQRARLLAQTPEGAAQALLDTETAARICPQAESPRLLRRLVALRPAPAGDEPALDEVAQSMQEAKGADSKDQFFLAELVFDIQAANSGKGNLSASSDMRPSHAAFRHFTTCLSLEPANYWALLHRSETSEEGRDSEQDRILRDLTAAQSLRPDLPFAAAGLGAWYAIAGNREEARRWYEKAISISPSEVLFYAGLAKVHVSEREWNKAVLALEKAVALDPGGYACGALADIYEKQGLLDDALNWHDQAVARSGSGRHGREFALKSKASLLEQIGRLEEARACYAAAVADAPNDAYVRQRLADLLRRAGSSAEALEHYHVALRLNPSDPLVHVGLGDLLRAVGNTAQSLKYYETAVELDPTAVPSGYAELLRGLGQRDKADALFRKAIALREAAYPRAEWEFSRLVMDYALFLWGEKDDNVAVALFQETLQKHPESVSLRFAYGQLLVFVRRPAEAIEQLHKVLGMDPSRLHDKTARFQLSEAYRLAGDVVRAAEELQWLLRLDPKDANARVRLTGYLRQLGQRTEAKRICTEGIQLVGEDMRLRAMLAGLAQDQGEIAEVVEHADKALNLALSCQSETMDREAAGVLDGCLGILRDTGQDAANLLERCNAIVGRYPYRVGKGIGFTKRAELLLQLQKNGEAEESARKALEQIPEYLREERMWPSVWLGMALQRQGKVAEALDVYLRTAESNPWMTPAHSNTVVLMMDTPEHAERGILECTVWLQVLDKVAKNTKTFEDVESKAAFLLCRAMLLVRLRRIDEAAADFHAARGLLPGSKFCESIHARRLTELLIIGAQAVKAEPLRTECEQALSAEKPAQPGSAPGFPALSP